MRFVKPFDDGDWCFFDGVEQPSTDNIVLVHLEHVLKRDPNLVELMELPSGHEASRDQIDEDWLIEETARR